MPTEDGQLTVGIPNLFSLEVCSVQSSNQRGIKPARAYTDNLKRVA
jgi:hypothetical protein